MGDSIEENIIPAFKELSMQSGRENIHRPNNSQKKSRQYKNNHCILWAKIYVRILRQKISTRDIINREGFTEEFCRLEFENLF